MILDLMRPLSQAVLVELVKINMATCCLLYTSDAADE